MSAVGYMIGVCLFFALIALLCWITDQIERDQ